MMKALQQEITLTLVSGCSARFLADSPGAVVPAAGRAWNLDTWLLSASVGSEQQPDS